MTNTNWSLDKLFSGDEDPLIEKAKRNLVAKSYEFISRWNKRCDYLEDPHTMKEALDEYEKWAGKYAGAGNVGYYFGLRQALEQNNPKIKAINNKLEEISTKISNDMAFFEHRIAKIPKGKQAKFLNSQHLLPYKHFLEDLFKQAKYLLSEEEEKILNLKSATSFSNWVRMTSSLLSKEEAEVLDEDNVKRVMSLSEILSLVDSRNKKTRDSATSALNFILAMYADIAENEINSILQDKKVDDDIRKMERPDLARHLSDDIDSLVVDKLIESVSKRFDLSRDYYKLKAKLLGVEKLKYNERNVPYGEIGKNYTYEEAVLLIQKVLRKLNPKFEEIYKGLYCNGHFDVLPKKGKAGGAFCSCGLKSQPIYILLNFTKKLSDVTTMAHETGHAINDYLMKQNENALNCGNPLSLAEVSSTFIEDFVLKELLKGANDELRLAILMSELNEDISTIFRQVAFYKFEWNLHKEFRERGYLSKEDIGNLFREHMESYMGEFVEQSEGSENWWVYIGHFRNFFYVYSYASGLLISKALQNMVNKDPKDTEKIENFMSIGKSKAPKDIFLDLGIDISSKKFWDSGLSEVEELLNEAESLAQKIHPDKFRPR